MNFNKLLRKKHNSPDRILLQVQLAKEHLNCKHNCVTAFSIKFYKVLHLNTKYSHQGYPNRFASW